MYVKFVMLFYPTVSAVRRCIPVALSRPLPPPMIVSEENVFLWSGTLRGGFRKSKPFLVIPDDHIRSAQKFQQDSDAFMLVFCFFFFGIPFTIYWLFLTNRFPIQSSWFWRFFWFFSWSNRLRCSLVIALVPNAGRKTIVFAVKWVWFIVSATLDHTPIFIHRRIISQDLDCRFFVVIFFVR